MNIIDRLDQAAYEMHHALQVICQTPDIRSFLSNLDPQALAQCEKAIEVYQHRSDRTWFAERYERP